MALISTNVDREENSIEVTFIDRGIQFNPIESKDTDINAPLFQRKKGGLGIFYVKKKVDDISYYYKDDENVLKIKKIFRG